MTLNLSDIPEMAYSDYKKWFISDYVILFNCQFPSTTLTYDMLICITHTSKMSERYENIDNAQA